LVHDSILVASSHFAQVPDGYTLPSDTAHLDGVSESELVVDGCFLVVSQVVVDYPQINVSKEFACNICNFLVLRMELNSLLVAIRIALSQLHVVHSNAVVGQCLSMHIANCFAHLEELLVLINGGLIFP
jgi:hypothetical protein